MGLITSNSWKQKQSTSDQPLASGCELHYDVETTFCSKAVSIVCTILSLLHSERSLHTVLKLMILTKWISSVPQSVPEEKFGKGVKVSKLESFFCTFISISGRKQDFRKLASDLSVASYPAFSLVDFHILSFVIWF